MFYRKKMVCAILTAGLTLSLMAPSLTWAEALEPATSEQSAILAAADEDPSSEGTVVVEDGANKAPETEVPSDSEVVPDPSVPPSSEVPPDPTVTPKPEVPPDPVITPDPTEPPQVTETPVPTQQPEETPPATVTPTPGVPQVPEATQTPAPTEPVPEEPAEEPDTDNNKVTTNDALIARQQIVTAPVLFTHVDKVYAIANVNTYLNVREGKGTDSRVVGVLNKDALCFILADADQEWVYVESGEVRGFVYAQYLLTGDEAVAFVNEQGEDNLALAELKISAAENAAYRYTTTTTKDVAETSAIRTSMVQYAEQFLGNPYVWGGTDLINGTDCSGFTQGIYAAFGYEIPRVSRDQAEYGTQIPIEDAEPGDLIFYARNGVVYHVLMYIGDGKVIHASSPSVGIVITDINYNNAVWATRVISDTDRVVLSGTELTNGATEVTMASSATEGTYLGTFKLTSYCNCAICCGKWADGLTASGTWPTEGRTVAMAGVPFGTKLNINGQIFTVEDRGTPYAHVDVFITDHQRASDFGVQYADVYMVG
ncbi:MAG: NlpC/P60 family protein [Lachnospiraceae bacterium]|nr:NlpC/P60 family protein [Lachnospiraceae bacterium]